tara:strand:- start:320 stop:535 length:216 start_codon:yes stop_codon:yes gene_type:complete
MIVKTHWNDEGLHKFYGHNNNGLIWGINYIDEETQDVPITVDCEWFKTRQQRNQKYKKIKETKCHNAINVV